MAGGRVKLGEVADAPESQSVGLEKYTQEIFIFFHIRICAGISCLPVSWVVQIHGVLCLHAEAEEKSWTDIRPMKREGAAAAFSMDPLCKYTILVSRGAALPQRRR